MLLFLIPIFYPISALSEFIFDYSLFDPFLTFTIELARIMVLYGPNPNWTNLITYYTIACSLLGLA